LVDGMAFELRFPARCIGFWAETYRQKAKKKDWELENRLLTEIAPRARKRGYFTKPDFLDLCRWKSPRPMASYEENSEEFIEDTIRVALSAMNEQLRINVLTVLSGVKWPVASAILHFAHREPYPILDRRALSSLSVDIRGKYDFG